MNISKKLCNLRTEYNLTQSQLAKIAGVSDKAISAWELGTRDPKIKSIQNICAYFGIDLNSFIDQSTETYKKDGLTPNSGSEPIGPAKRALLEAVKDVDDASAQVILDIVQSVKKLRGE